MRYWILLCWAAILAPAWAADNADVPALLKTLQATGPESTGQHAAVPAAQTLSQLPATELPAVLAALDNANPIAANWIHSVVDAIAERNAKKLPIAELEKFLADTGHSTRARRLAFELIAKVDATAPTRLIPGMLDDPSLELRRDAVAQAIAKAERLAEQAGPNSPQALAAFRAALVKARDIDQIKSLAEKLKKADPPLDLPVQMGFVLEWKLIGPFDNTDKKGYPIAYPPEKELNFQATYDGKPGKVHWQDYQSNHPFGEVDLNVALTKHMGAVAYAYYEFDAVAATDAELRLGCVNANKLWFNGKFVFENDTYHANSDIDQYVGKVRLRPGKNEILLKICQNEQTEAWAQDWKFQLRVCDAVGTAILAKNRAPTPKLVEIKEEKK